jgi:uncharacterized protein (DUF1330 family)
MTARLAGGGAPAHKMAGNAKGGRPMAKGYLIANIEVTDPAAFDQYRSTVAPTIAAHGGRYLVRGPEIRHLEGSLGLKRLVVLEFPSLGDAEAFYRSDAYKPLLELRTRSTKSDVVLVEGYDPPA